MWLVLPLLPVLNVRIFGDGNFAHDRYLYIPSVGFSLLAALVLRRARLGPARLLGLPAIQVALALVLACGMGLSAASQSSPYANRISFFTHAYAGAPGNDAAKWNVAGLLVEQGNYAEAEKLLQDILGNNADSAYVNYDIGYTYYLMGRLEDAEYYLLRAGQLLPQFSDGFFYLGMTQLRMGHFGDAVLNIRRALALSPYSDDYHFGLGLVLKMQHNLPGALVEFRAELALNPGHTQARRQITETENALRTVQAPDSVTRPQP